MNHSALSAYGAQSFNFDFTTSTGDKISLDLAKEQSVSYENDGSTETFTFERSRTLHLQIEGNGLDENDLAELNVALEAVGEELDAFINPQDEFTKALNETAQSIINLLPVPESDAQKNFFKSGLASTFDSIIPKVPEEEAQEDSTIQKASQLLDELFYQLDNIEKQPIYA